MIKSRGQPKHDEEHTHVDLYNNRYKYATNLRIFICLFVIWAGLAENIKILQLCCDLRQRAVVRCPLASWEQSILLPILWIPAQHAQLVNTYPPGLAARGAHHINWPDLS